MKRTYAIAIGIGIGSAVLMISVLPTWFGHIAAVNPLVPQLIKMQGGLKPVALVLHDLVLMSLLLLPLSVGLVAWNKPHFALQTGVAALLFVAMAYSGLNITIITAAACLPLSVLLVQLIVMKAGVQSAKA